MPRTPSKTPGKTLQVETREERAHLERQRRIIDHIFAHGTQAEIDQMDVAFNDPELDPRVRAMIARWRAYSPTEQDITKK